MKLIIDEGKAIFIRSKKNSPFNYMLAWKFFANPIERQSIWFAWLPLWKQRESINVKETPHKSAILWRSKNKICFKLCYKWKRNALPFSNSSNFYDTCKEEQGPLTLMNLDSNAIITPILHWLASKISMTLAILTSL